MNTPQAEQLGRGIMTLCPRQMGTLPLIAPFLSALQVRRIVNGLVPSQADIDPGRIVELLVLNRLLAPKPLYQVSDWFAETVLPEVLVSVRSKSTIIVWDVTWTGFILTRYQDIWRPFTFEHQGEQVTDRVLVVWSAGKQRLDAQKRKTYLKRFLNGLAHIQKKLNSWRYKKRSCVEQRLAKPRQGNPVQDLVDIQLRGEDNTLQLNFHINQQKLAAAQELDGRYPLATNAAHLEANEALTVFKGQDGVEKRFRTVKGPLLVRPLFVRSDQRIESLVFITLLALLVRAILERACRSQEPPFTADRLFQDFATLQYAFTSLSGLQSNNAPPYHSERPTGVKNLAVHGRGDSSTHYVRSE